MIPQGQGRKVEIRMQSSPVTSKPEGMKVFLVNKLAYPAITTSLIPLHTQLEIQWQPRLLLHEEYGDSFNG